MKTALALAVLACACSGAAAPANRDEAAPRESSVTRGEVAVRVLLTGELRPGAANAVQLQVPRTEQNVSIRWIADDGAALKAGERAIEFDDSAFTSDLESKRISATEAQATAHNALELAKIALADKESELHQHELELAKAKLVAEVPTDLQSAHDAQQHQLDLHRAEVAVDKARRDLESQRKADALENHVKELARDKATGLVDTAERSIKELVITAPQDGVVVIADHPWEGRKFQIGDSMWPGFTIATMPNLDQALEVHADLSDVDDGQVGVGMAGTCTLDAYPAEAVPCKVTELTPVARDKGRKSLRRAFAITLVLAKRDERQRPGMSVRVEIKHPAASGLVVPRGAIDVGSGSAPRVSLPGGDSREVTLGACDAQNCIVDKGLADGDKVVIP